jgi:hypothetical protein
MWVGFNWLSLGLYFWLWPLSFSDRPVGLIEVQNLWTSTCGFSGTGFFFFSEAFFVEIQ